MHRTLEKGDTFWKMSQFLVESLQTEKEGNRKWGRRFFLIFKGI